LGIISSHGKRPAAKYPGKDLDFTIESNCGWWETWIPVGEGPVLRLGYVSLGFKTYKLRFSTLEIALCIRDVTLNGEILFTLNDETLNGETPFTLNEEGFEVDPTNRLQR
jgi:hypothetical protein